MIKRNIPNALTCSNLLCGCVGIVEAFHGNLLLSCVLVGVALIFDFFDGFVARLLKVTSPIGKDLDSLADMVTFGVLPSVIMYQLLMRSLPELGDIWKAYPAFVIAIFSAVRLARFNNDPRQSDGFIGVPTPANAMLIASLPIIERQYENLSPYIINTTNLLILSFAMSVMLVIELPLLALKFKNFSWRDNAFRYVFLVLSVLLVIIFKIVAVPFIIILYILVSVIFNISNSGKGDFPVK